MPFQDEKANAIISDKQTNQTLNDNNNNKKNHMEFIISNISCFLSFAII